MFNPARSDDKFTDSENMSQSTSSHGAQLPIKKSDNTGWQTVQFPGTVSIDDISGNSPKLQPNAMDSSSTHSNSTFEPTEQTTSQRETELLNLVRDLNECNDVLLAKVSQLEDSLERSQTALQAEIDRCGGDREIVQLVTELEQSNQALQHHKMLSESLQTELSASQKRATQLETEHAILLRQTTEQSQELLQANADRRDLRARLQRQQRYTLQFKAALEKCLTISQESPDSSTANFDMSGLTMPKADEIRPWVSALGQGRLDPQLESMIRGIQSTSPTETQLTDSTLEAEAEDQLWHDLARVVDAEEVVPDLEAPQASSAEEESPQFTEPSPWGAEPTKFDSALETAETAPAAEATDATSQLSPQAAEILARIQSAKGHAVDTYLPAMSAQGSPSPLVKPLRPQKRIGSLAAIDLPNFPRLKKQAPKTEA
ncbi:MAG: hypothetical protein AAGI69_08545 [Cyanobacteria bacterium P01_H01_bin.21]